MKFYDDARRVVRAMDLGLSKTAAALYQRLAVQWDDARFESEIAPKVTIWHSSLSRKADRLR